jgi:hypothetical protein
MINVLSPCWQSILLTTTWHVWYTDEHVVIFLAEHTTILLCGRHPPINFHVCVLHLKIIHTKSSLQNLLGIQSSSATLLCSKELSVCIMEITRAGAITAAAKAASTSRENEKRRKSAARKHEWRKSQSEDRRSETRQTDVMGHAEGRSCLPEEQQSEIRQTDLMGHAEGHACLSEEGQSEIWQTNQTGHAEGRACLSEEYMPAFPIPLSLAENISDAISVP